MPLLDLQNQLGIDVDRWLLVGSSKQPHKQATLCFAFQKEWLECSDGIGSVRAKKECQQEMEDLAECLSKKKMEYLQKLTASSHVLLERDGEANDGDSSTEGEADKGGKIHPS
uniref:NADH dehydrogenase [ubiquinone] iron-sulfur protein 5 isoform X1 n=1 Tax=Podarcis muralis TaxID=64176 RepID=UPI0010A06FFB|nr:NADH dehydrogenase [ubiquinone] iron-sulfur protein 5 isoform X1 [Podarcis muralis]XP_028594946.1 NADH dehydrogenase [ubiquinone] iron-sulfur protein 5 isoform X1 [Podarcis muralis]